MNAIELKSSIAYEAGVIRDFTTGEDCYEVRDTVFEDYPKLKSLLKNCKSEDILSVVKSHLKDYYERPGMAGKVELFRKNLEKSWHLVEEPVLQIFSDIFGYDINTLPKAVGYVGSLSVNPRDIAAHTFMVGLEQPIYSALKTILHEYTHFVYFKKWKELFPLDLTEADTAPGKLWQLSEVLAVVINSDERFLKYIPDAENQDFRFNGKSYFNVPMPGSDYSVMGYYKKLYVDHKEKGLTMEGFLRDCRTSFMKLDLSK